MGTRRHKMFVAVAVLCVPTLAAQNLAAALPVVVNQRLPLLCCHSVGAGGRVAFLAPESGTSDLNGDGDTSDVVMHIWDPATGATTNLRLAAPFEAAAHRGGRIDVIVSEKAQGATDLNGDGDAADWIVHLWDPATGTTTNLGLATQGIHPTELDGGWLALAVPESAQGAADLNGDGDATDDVVEVWDPATGRTTNLGLATRSRLYNGSDLVALDGGRLAFVVGEGAQRRDLNADGDRQDMVVHVWDPATKRTTNLRLASGVPGDTAAALDGGRLAFIVPEASQGAADLNGDGDADDKVAHVWDPAGIATANLRLATGAHSLFGLGGGRLALVVSESSQGNADRNGDGDVLDTVLHHWDPVAGATNLQVATGRWGLFAALGEGRLAFSVSEAMQGTRDLNGDRDARDAVLHVLDPTGGPPSNLRLAYGGTPLALEGGGVAVRVLETAQGRRDLDGDGDTNDAPIHVWDPATGTTRNIGLSALGWAALRRGRIAVSVSESFVTPTGTDLNGDGDKTDEVVQLWDPSTGVTNLGLAGANLLAVGDGGLAFGVREASQNNADLNGDGDTDDYVLHTLLS